MKFNLIAGMISGAIFVGSLAWILEVNYPPILPLIGLILSSFVYGVLMGESDE